MKMHKLRDLCGLFNGNPIWSSVGLPIRIPDGSHITALVKKMKGITGACLEILCNEISRLLFNVSHKDYNTGMFTIYNKY